MLIERFSLKEITVNMLVCEAKCTRGSFYYHFDDINTLVQRVLEHNFPIELPHALLALAMEKDNLNPPAITSDSAFVKKIDRICLLVGPHSSIEVSESVKQAIRNAWTDAFPFDISELPAEATLLFEFLVNGIVGVLAYRSRLNVDFDLYFAFKVLMPVPQIFIRHLIGIMEGAEAIDVVGAIRKAEA